MRKWTSLFGCAGALTLLFLLAAPSPAQAQDDREFLKYLGSVETTSELAKVFRIDEELVGLSFLDALVAGEVTSEVIGPFDTYDVCRQSANDSTVKHSGCYPCGHDNTKWCYKTYPTSTAPAGDTTTP
jgi:hypothetical protein